MHGQVFMKATVLSVLQCCHGSRLNEPSVLPNPPRKAVSPTVTTEKDRDCCGMAMNCFKQDLGPPIAVSLRGYWQLHAPLLTVHRKWSRHQKNQKQDLPCLLRIHSIMSLVAAWNFVTCKGQGLQDSGVRSKQALLETVTFAQWFPLGSISPWGALGHIRRTVLRVPTKLSNCC